VGLDEHGGGYGCARGDLQQCRYDDDAPVAAPDVIAAVELQYEIMRVGHRTEALTRTSWPRNVCTPMFTLW
jgi:hypothetical protein